MADSNTALVSMAQQFTGLPMNDLIGGPLNAAAKANAAMALTQTKFMLDTCFYPTQTSPPGTKGGYTPIMINMKLTRGSSTQQTSPPSDKFTQNYINFDLPLLTIIPLNSLAVQTVDINFEMEVKSSYSEDQSKASEEKVSAGGSFSAKLGWGPLSVEVKGNASYDKSDSSNFSTHYEKSNSAKYTVNVTAGQLPLPKGVNTIIEAYTRAITPLEGA